MSLLLAPQLLSQSSGLSFQVSVAANTYNFNLRDAVLAEGWDGVTPASIECEIELGVVIGSVDVASAAFTASSFPVGCSIVVLNRGRIQGMGGRGGGGGGQQTPAGKPGEDGGDAIFTDTALSLDNTAGEVWGGGGGGGGGYNNAGTGNGGGGAGGGAGTDPGAGGSHGGGSAQSGTDGTSEVGGVGGYGGSGNSIKAGDGGGPGEDGEAPSSGGAPGVAGKSINGSSYVTILAAGDIRGPVSG
tara:strand:+ start:933 stop:1664 length:732 start_codon:yes stop_codon:yes gene_type:complete